METKTTKIYTIEALRGVAAFAVCCFHLVNGNLHFTGYNSLLYNVASWGWLGVEVFFVISGFIIPYSMWKSEYSWQQFPKFILRRSVRIEVPYLASLILVILLNYASRLSPGFQGDSLSFRIDLLQVSSHFVYLTEILGYKWLQVVYWTLAVEFVFYLNIGFFLPLLGMQKWSKYAIIIFFVTFFCFFIPEKFQYANLFLIGIVGAMYKTKKIERDEWMLLTVSLLFFATIVNSPIIVNLTGFLTIICICFFDINLRLLNFLGKISFSLYLVHIPIGGRVINLGNRYALTQIAEIFVFLLSLAACLISAIIFYKYIEKPAFRLSKSLYKNAKK